MNLVDRAPTGPSHAAARRHATAVGARRGWLEFVLSVRSRQDQTFYLVTAAGVLTYLWFVRDDDLGSLDLPYVAFVLPSVLGALVVFGAIMGPASALTLERQDGTLLRSRLVPHGLVGYTVGQVVLHTLSALPLLVTIVVPSFLLFDGVTPGRPLGWALLVLAPLLGLFATLPLGIALGAVIPGGPQKLGLYAMLPLTAVIAISGIFVPLPALWGWLQVVGQLLPMYWLGHLFRAGFLPSGAAEGLEPLGAYRPGLAVAVLLVWGVIGCLLAPPLLRRMSRRQSGSQVAEARDEAAQFVR